MPAITARGGSIFRQRPVAACRTTLIRVLSSHILRREAVRYFPMPCAQDFSNIAQESCEEKGEVFFPLTMTCALITYLFVKVAECS
jgi:hypothetical protein